ncbi:hypothetical protein [Mesotoga sp.]|uniref:hypothetical protein n=1 Tax=Mesotoga sp. TaxID=2053577 RepID=UPI001BD4CF48|nr:hypothetical protein [Mesotoga sp.]
MPVTFDGQSADAGHFRLRRLNKKTRKSFVERFAALTREEREKKPVILSFALHTVKRVHVLKRTAELLAYSGSSSEQRIFRARSRAGASRDD